MHQKTAKGQKRSERNVTHVFNKSKHILMLVLLHAQYCDSCPEDLSNYCEADCTLLDCSNGTFCMPHPTLTNYPAVIDPQARCLLILIKLKSIWRNIFKRKTEDRLVHGVLTSPLLTNAEPHNLKHPEDGAETSCTIAFILLLSNAPQR